jgi:hypothetical protein
MPSGPLLKKKSTGTFIGKMKPKSYNEKYRTTNHQSAKNKTKINYTFQKKTIHIARI